VLIDIDLRGGEATLELIEPDDCKRFHVAVHGGDRARLAESLTATGVGCLDESGDAYIEAAAVRQLASGRVSSAWEADFSAMLAYASTKGWLSDTGNAIRAHVEWLQ
jgi:hypothetical protein